MEPRHPESQERSTERAAPPIEPAQRRRAKIAWALRRHCFAPAPTVSTAPRSAGQRRKPQARADGAAKACRFGLILAPADQIAFPISCFSLFAAPRTPWSSLRAKYDLMTLQCDI
jgi:hypothetical protein